MHFNFECNTIRTYGIKYFDNGFTIKNLNREMGRDEYSGQSSLYGNFMQSHRSQWD